MTATADLLHFAAADHRLPDPVRADAVRLLGDTLAVGMAGVGAPGEWAVSEVACGCGHAKEARLLGSAERLPAASAAFVNGFRIHCLEWDAVHEGAVVHALSVVTAALGAAIDRRGGCDADEALCALSVGVDVAVGLGLAATGAMRFFRPATAGVVGATLAVARLDEAPLEAALGLACASAAGTMQAHLEGSETLPFQIGNAARAAVMASDLALAGLGAPADPLEGPFGYFSLIEKGDLASYTRHLGNVWRISDVSVKPFPCGRASHASLAALQHFSLDARGDVEQIEVAAPALVRRLVDRPYRADMNPAYARLCLPWLAALMLTHGRIDPRRFTSRDFADPHLAAVAGKVVMVPDGNEDPNALAPQTLAIRWRGGTREEQRTTAILGSPAAPLSTEQTAGKYDLIRELASKDADQRILADPLAYWTDPS
ncbi:MmgE/PrpD family protein [Porphyrobacter sp. GA68]|uniref:MmgE/PrpD family protein n=1 Tax=Porphyrobacter sp. GA68 TaxID=2883480 RepID=UPI001D18E3BE|nr:MmgE/PrpD family protein [Porphyrobacter sp. GA68]